MKVSGTTKVLLKEAETSSFLPFIWTQSNFTCQILSFLTFVGFILLFCHLFFPV